MKTDLNQLYTLENVTRTFDKTLDSLLFERLYTINHLIDRCVNKDNLEYLHNHRDHVINLMLVHEGKVEEVKDINGACYTVIRS